MSADQARIRALQDELRRVKEQLQEERRQAAVDKTAATRESRHARQEAHDQLTSQMSEIATALTNIGQEKSSCAEHVEERAAQIRQTCTEQDAKLDDVLDAVRSIRDEQETTKTMLEEEKALSASKPSVETVLEEIRVQQAANTEAITMLSRRTEEDARRQHEELRSLLLATASARESVSFDHEE